MQTQCAGKVISTARRNDQHGKAKTNQRSEMTVDGAIATEDQNGIGVVRRRRQTFNPLRRRSSLKLLQLAGGGPQTEDGSGAHDPGFGLQSCALAKPLYFRHFSIN